MRKATDREAFAAWLQEPDAGVRADTWNPWFGQLLTRGYNAAAMALGGGTGTNGVLRRDFTALWTWDANAAAALHARPRIPERKRPALQALAPLVAKKPTT
jgi:hypothetical protein